MHAQEAWIKVVAAALILAFHNFQALDFVTSIMLP